MQRKEVTQMHVAILRGFPTFSVLAALVATMLAMTLAPVTGAGPDAGESPVRHHVCPPLC
jgi:hypothetical protein